MDNFKQIQEAIINAVNTIVEKKLKKIKRNYYVDGVIKNKNDNFTYNVLIANEIYKNIPSKSKLNYEIGDTVQILVKNGDWNQKFIDNVSYHNKFLTSKQYNSIDGTGAEFPLICHNGSNIWIGAIQRAGRHHAGVGTYGKTFISSGYNSDLRRGNETIYVSVPNDNNDEATNYKVMHSGNLIDYTYPVGSVYISGNNTNPTSSFGGTWSLIDKDFAPFCTDSTSSYFTKNNTNTTSYTIAFSRANHAIYTRITFVNAKDLSDTPLTMGKLDLSSLGVTDLTYTKYGVGYSDGGNGVFMCKLESNGDLSVVDIVENNTNSQSTIASGSNCIIEFVHEIKTDSMLDSACNKFYWKRTA